MHRRFAIVPAGGTGTRFGGGHPKQFTVLCGQPLLVHSIATLHQNPAVDSVFVVLAPEHRDAVSWEQWDERVVPLFCAGNTRVQTVLNALDQLAGVVAGEDWVLVHDAARPCLSQAALTRLLETVSGDVVGGLLAVPVADTLKRQDASGRVMQTIDREGLWAAQTPQMFRYDVLRRALRDAPSATDEASAVEALGHAPLLVMGEATNIKVTYPADLMLAEWILSGRNSTRGMA